VTVVLKTSLESKPGSVSSNNAGKYGARYGRGCISGRKMDPKARMAAGAWRKRRESGEKVRERQTNIKISRATVERGDCVNSSRTYAKND